jgi:hypothetical protein
MFGDHDYLHQVKIGKGVSKQETVNVCDGTDPLQFYCARNGNGMVLKGFEKKRELIHEALSDLQYAGYSLQQMLVVQNEGDPTPLIQSALVVTKANNPV